LHSLEPIALEHAKDKESLRESVARLPGTVKTDAPLGNFRRVRFLNNPLATDARLYIITDTVYIYR
jgi:hypothetical protein